MSRDWLSCDWGTTHLRLRHVDAAGRVRATVRSGQGASVLANDGADGRTARFQKALAELVTQLVDESGEALSDGTIVVSGMASSSIGWQTLPYAEVPFRLDGGDAIWRELGPLPLWPGTRVIVVSGVRTKSDVMRGEETEVLGAAAWLRDQRESSRVTLVLPGTHSKHCELDGSAMTSFRTYLTGELFDVLTTHSLLRHSTRSAVVDVAVGREKSESFAAGVRCTQAMSLSAAMFQVRTRELLAGEPPAANAAFLSGLLIGAELRDLAVASPPVPVVLCAGPELSAAYQAASQLVGLADRLTVVPPNEVELLAVRGQLALLERILPETS